jgi:chemotaxis protein histidine kinase CheA
MDFGIAKALGGSTKTRTGLQMGTPQYMSPEQIRGRQVDARSDLYSLGITLYQLLSGDLPFHADSDYELMSAHINTPPPVLTDIHADVPRGMEQCVRKALAKEPEGRFQNADEFGTALDRASKLPSDLLETHVEFIPSPGFPQDREALSRKTIVDTATPARQRTIIETQVPRIPTPAPAVAPVQIPAPRKKSALVPILIAVLVGAAIAGGGLWKYLQPSPQPAVIVTPPNKGQSNGGTGTQNGSNGVNQSNQKLPGTVQTPQQSKIPPVVAKVPEKTRATTPPVNQPKASLVVLCTLDCTWTLDGSAQGQLAAGRPTSMQVSQGEHIITASTVDGADSNDMTVTAESNRNVAARMDLATKRNQRLQLEAVQQRQQQQQQQQQAAQAEIARRQEAARQQQAQAQAAAQARAQATAQSTQMTPAITSPCQIPALPQLWRNVTNNGRYHFRIDCEHADIYDAGNRVVADLVMKKNKYAGTSLLSPCGGGRGKMEILSITPGRIDARVEIPNPMNRLCTNGNFLAFTNWTMASFIPE